MVGEWEDREREMSGDELLSRLQLKSIKAASHPFLIMFLEVQKAVYLLPNSEWITLISLNKYSTHI